MNTAECPTYPLPTLLARVRMLQELLTDLQPEMLWPRQCRIIVDRVIQRMPRVYRPNGKGGRESDPVMLEKRRVALLGVLRPFREQSLSPDERQWLLTKQLAGNWETLCRGVEWLPWENYQEPTWTTVFFADVERQVGLKDRLYVCEFEAYTGAAAGQRWTQLFSGGFLQVLIRECGVSRYALWDDTDIGGMWFNCWLRSDGHRVRFRDVRPSSTQLDYNRALAITRQGTCAGPFFSNGRDKCFNCPRGREMCEYSRHELEYDTKALCANYQVKEGKAVRHNGYVTTHSEGVCLHCLNQGVIRRDVIQMILDARQTWKVKRAESPKADHPAQGGARSRFRAWHPAVWAERPGSVPEPHA